MRATTVGLSAICIMLAVNNIFNVSATKDVEQAIKETRPTAEEQIVEEQIVNHYNTTNNYNETHNHYESNDNDEKIEELEEKITQLEDKEETNDTGIVSVGVNQQGVVYNQQPQQVRDPWRGPKNYKCNKAAGYPAICGYCGEQGEIHFNIDEWQDTQGTYHLTHRGCGQLYCNELGVEPRIEESYKIR